MTSVADRYRVSAKTGPSASFLFLLLAALALTGCDTGPQLRTFNGSTMGTSYQVKVVEGGVKLPADAEQQIFAAIDAVDQAMTTYSDDSELNRLNRAPVGTTVPLSAPLFEVLEISADIYRDSGGAFDPTVGPLVDLWGFGPAFTDDSIPTDDQIQALLATIGFHHLHLDSVNQTATRRADIRLDLSAVAKGYGADMVADYLRSLQMDNFMVEVGGEMVLAGHNLQGLPWQIAIEAPSQGERSVERVIPVSDMAVATSGDYRNFFEKDGQRFSHTLDPRSGRPIVHGLASVTVVMRTAAEADALATALMVMGDKAALAFAEERDIPLFLLVKEGDGFREYHSTAFQPYLIEVN